jgi:hypothetical protein
MCSTCATPTLLQQHPSRHSYLDTYVCRGCVWLWVGHLMGVSLKPRGAQGRAVLEPAGWG